MNIELIESNTTTNYTFNIEHKGEQYNVTVYLNESGRFIDDIITNAMGDDLEYEGEEGQIREEIINYLDENWDRFVG
jgi:glycine cleavage system aminomethyltransferase T